MHAITSCIAVVDAGRHRFHFQSLDVLHTQNADAVIGLGIFLETDKSVARSSVRKMLSAVERKKAAAHFSMLKKGGKVRLLAAAAAVKQWKARTAEMSMLSKGKVPGADSGRMKRLVHHAQYLVAFHEENEKARLALKTSALDYCTSEEFDEAFPPSLQYISRDLAEEIADNVWAELVSARK